MPPDRIAPLHFCLVETPQLRVFVNVPGAGTVINTAISTALRYAIFPAGFRVPLPIPGMCFALNLFLLYIL